MEDDINKPGPTEWGLVCSAGEIAPQKDVIKRGNDHARAK